MSRLGSRRHRRGAAEQGVQAFPDVRQAGAMTHRCEGVRIAGIVDRDRQPIAGAAHVDADAAAVHELGDPVGHGIFDERLQKQRRDARGERAPGKNPIPFTAI